jgi:hypothetical protein
MLLAFFGSDALASAAKNGALERLLCAAGVPAEIRLDIGDEIRTPMSMHVVRQLPPFSQLTRRDVNC